MRAIMPKYSNSSYLRLDLFLRKYSSRIPYYNPPLKNLLYIDQAHLQKQGVKTQLRDLQIEFFKDTSDCHNAYRYVRELNRWERYSNIAYLNNRIFKPNQNFYMVRDINNYKKLQLQLKYTYKKLGYQDDYLIKKPVSYMNRLIYMTMISGMLYYFLSEGEQERKEREIRLEIIEKMMQDKEKQATKEKKGFFTSIFQKQQEISEEQHVKARFSDVVGIDEYKEELEDVLDYLRNPEKYIEGGAKLPKGLLLVGEPGTGKTLLARALAGEADCSFFYKSGSEFDEIYVGVGASRMRELFKKAREKAPSIIFLDEIDAIGRQRTGQDAAHTRDTINQILTEMDGFRKNEKVIVVAATNLENTLDPALKRPGRFDKIIHIPLPDIKGRKQIFDHYLSLVKVNKVNTTCLAEQTTGFSGADIKNLVNLAVLNAIKLGRSHATKQDFDAAYDRVIMGVRRNLVISEEDKKINAYHHAAQALIAKLSKLPIHKVSILPQGGNVGFISTLPPNDWHHKTRENIMAHIDMALAGRAAQEIIFGTDNISTKIGQDLEKATNLAYEYVKELGMEDNLIANIKTSRRFNYDIDVQVKRILGESYKRVKRMLKKRKSALNNIAKQLLEKETLTDKDL